MTLASHPELAVAIDGADEIDPELNCIKGGGGCALQEKVVAACAQRLLIVADYTKESSRCGVGAVGVRCGSGGAVQYAPSERP